MVFNIKNLQTALNLGYVPKAIKHLPFRRKQDTLKNRLEGPCSSCTYAHYKSIQMKTRLTLPPRKIFNAQNSIESRFNYFKSRREEGNYMGSRITTG